MDTQLCRRLVVVLALLTSAIERGGGEPSSRGLCSWGVEGPLLQIGDAQPGASSPNPARSYKKARSYKSLQKLRGGGACIPVLNPEHDPAAGDDLGTQLLRAAALGNTRLVTPPNPTTSTKPNHFYNPSVLLASRAPAQSLTSLPPLFRHFMASVCRCESFWR